MSEWPHGVRDRFRQMIDSMNTTRDRPGAPEIWAVTREYMQSMGVEAPDGLTAAKDDTIHEGRNGS
jgi:hypothetical protein